MRDQIAIHFLSYHVGVFSRNFFSVFQVGERNVSLNTENVLLFVKKCNFNIHVRYEKVI